MPAAVELIDRPTRRRAGGLPSGAPSRGLPSARPATDRGDPSCSTIVGGIFAAGLIARGEAAGADARAYWAGVRIWLNGGDPYHPTGPFLPYVYAPWMLPRLRAVGAAAVGRRLVRLAGRDDPRCCSGRSTGRTASGR